MYTRNQDGFYGRTEAFNLLKDFLGIPRSCTINKNFFLHFFTESHSGFFIRKPEEEIKKVFDQHGIPALNKRYFEAKKNGDPAGAQSISEEILRKVTGAFTKKAEPYFVKQ